LTQLSEQHLDTARDAASGRSAVTVYGGQEHDMRQTLIALAAGARLHEHESPGEATLQVLVGRVRLTAGEESWDGGAGDHLVIPPQRHGLEALTDAAVLLTVATRA
jgi:quercetin dioxygenase-like cupin family protein